ncbi:hypothetical protein WOLCODRAFT_138173 [Wolfiporia cocos MD-104 SS10]|uniref:Rap-GAP domain-containing protein n=1 Tax=Wolfiporia cocos (strain MD-104) TaxID=742152 RepID=A0A2H3JVV8_WOLCO|nr:hypothetical protein WOLCODRAFT_138173 [Wolfiporia cocos MD-104 SS10]
MEGSLLKVLSSWITGAFEGLTRHGPVPPEEQAERQRSVETLTAFLTTLVGEPEFVSRLSEHDTSSVIELWAELIDQSLLIPQSEEHLLRIVSSSRAHISLSHRRHRSSTSIPQTTSLKHPADIVVDAYLTYLETRLRALAHSHLKNILPPLFRCLAVYATPLPRISLTPSVAHQDPIEKRILDTLTSLVSGPFSSSCTNLMKHHLFPSDEPLQVSVQTTRGALRTLRKNIRDILIMRLARAYIARESSVDYSPAGAPAHINLERDLMERAWSKDDTAAWDLLRFRSVLCRAIRAWIAHDFAGVGESEADSAREKVLSEIAAILKDVIQALDERNDVDDVDDEEVGSVGDILHELVAYVHRLKDPHGGQIVISLSQTNHKSLLVNAILPLLAQDLRETPLYPVLPSIILAMAEHVTDTDTAGLLRTMSDRQSLSPTSPTWLVHWGSILAIPRLFTATRPHTREVAMDMLGRVWEFVKDIPVYRRPLAELVLDFWKKQRKTDIEDVSVTVIWYILGDEAVLRMAEGEGKETCGADRGFAEDIMSFLISIASEKHNEDDDVADNASVRTAEYHSVSPPAPPVPTAATSPVLSRVQSDYQSTKDRDTIPTMISILSSLTSGNSSRSQCQPRQPTEPTPVVEPPPAAPPPPPLPRSVGAVVALISIFSQLAFTSLVNSEHNVSLAVRIFRTLVGLLVSAQCVRARLTVLQFLMRLRVDRDHRLYYASRDHDKDGNVANLAALINRGPRTSGLSEHATAEEIRSARSRNPQERNGRRPSRGRGGQPVRAESRSRSRTAARVVSTPASLRRLKPREPMWSVPETLPFSLAVDDTASEGIISYDPSGPREAMVLPFSQYLRTLLSILEEESEWEILSYVLCYLPTQLANKHLVCGPRSRDVLNMMVSVMCAHISDGSFASNIERWPDNVAARDAYELVYHTLTVLISYKRCFPELQLQHHLVEVFFMGLSEQPSTVKCCLHALSLSAFELQPSMTRYISKILEKLSQIMSNSANAVHIIDFLAIVGSLPALHANFTEEDYKMVFAVALQYLQDHSNPGEAPQISWALSQHVLLMSYYIVYLWFLAVEQPDRARHIKFISRRLLLANQGKEKVDEPAEVCFDWLARYTYASADPRPANSMLNEIVMNPHIQRTPEPAISEKTWIAGTAVITVRALMRRGWMEVMTRRASGLTKFLCRSENVPMIPVGDVDPDMISVAAGLTLDRDIQSPGTSAPRGQKLSADASALVDDLQEVHQSTVDAQGSAARPDPITGYVWSGSAPSQRRKDVTIDPAYFALQLSSYPDNVNPSRLRLVTDHKALAKFCSTFDRMPVIDTHKVGIMYVAPGQKDEMDILRNDYGSPAYTRFLEGLGRLINLRGQVDVYHGGLDPDEDGEYAYAWWDDIGQILYHTATLMPSDDDQCINKKRHIGNDYVRIVWNDSGMPYRFDTLTTQFQFVNIVIEPHSRGAIAAFSDNVHENEYFKVTVQRVPGMTEATPIGDFKLISAENLPFLVRQISLVLDWFAYVYERTNGDSEEVEVTTNWRARLQAIKRFRDQMSASYQPPPPEEGITGQVYRDFTTMY